jgi:1-phosphatidylinositol-4-phosphate 5-kinase
MKYALSQSISSISHPAKDRPLNPKKDFTFESTFEHGPNTLKKQTKIAPGGGICKCAVKPRDPFPSLQRESAPSDDDDETVTQSPVSFIFTDFAPMCYRHIREFFRIDSTSYRNVLCQSNWVSIPTPGKSSAMLFFCGQNWVIKTMTTGESEFLQNTLHRYYYHVRDNPYTLLPHFVGHYRIVIDGGEPIVFVIMQNVFATTNKIHVKYDLKGSTVGRAASPHEKMKSTCTQKDLDINRPLFLGPKRRALLVEQLKRDCDFLERSGVMDYSLLVGIHEVGPSGQWPAARGTATRTPPQQHLLSVGDEDDDDGQVFTRDQGGMASSEQAQKPEIYYIGIIDILQEYTLWKRSETIVQGSISDIHQISSVHPKEYAARFISFMTSLIV